MIGIFGFLAAAIVFSAYASSLRSGNNLKVRIGSFKLAYLLLAAACIGWALGIASFNADVLSGSIVLGNLLILAGTVALIDTVIQKSWRRNVLIIMSALALFLTYIRAIYFIPEPYISSGVLVFNSQPVVAATFALIFVGVWLPVSLYVSRKITEKITVFPLQSIGAFSFVIATIGVSVFLAAREPLTLILSFGVLCLSFVSLIGVNYLQRKEEK